jgi:hypothetical protein
MTATPHGFWIAGGPHQARVLVCARAAVNGFAACSGVDANSEHFLSAFTYGAAFREHLEKTGSSRGFDGVCGADWIWWDVDREHDLQAALADTRALCLHLVDSFGVSQDDLLVFFSGSKGFHAGAPTALWNPAPSVGFNAVARRFAESVAQSVPGGAVVIDAIYDRVRAFRAPNSRHPKTGLHKRRLTVDELLGLNLDRIRMMAAAPSPFEMPSPTGRSQRLAAAWGAAEAAVAAEGEAMKTRAAAIVASGGPDSLNRVTLELLRAGMPKGDRHRLLFSAAANLAEFGCPPRLAHALLTEAGLDMGLAPSDVRRQIDCGIEHVRKGDSHG